MLVPYNSITGKVPQLLKGFWVTGCIGANTKYAEFLWPENKYPAFMSFCGLYGQSFILLSNPVQLSHLESTIKPGHVTFLRFLELLVNFYKLCHYTSGENEVIYLKSRCK